MVQPHYAAAPATATASFASYPATPPPPSSGYLNHEPARIYDDRRPPVKEIVREVPYEVIREVTKEVRSTAKSDSATTPAPLCHINITHTLPPASSIITTLTISFSLPPHAQVPIEIVREVDTYRDSHYYDYPMHGSGRGVKDENRPPGKNDKDKPLTYPGGKKGLPNVDGKKQAHGTKMWGPNQSGGSSGGSGGGSLRGRPWSADNKGAKGLLTGSKK